MVDFAVFPREIKLKRKNAILRKTHINKIEIINKVKDASYHKNLLTTKHRIFFYRKKKKEHMLLF